MTGQPGADVQSGRKWGVRPFAKERDPPSAFPAKSFAVNTVKVTLYF
jgi:hypothetical protein